MQDIIKLKPFIILTLLCGISLGMIGAKGCLWWRDNDNNDDVITGSSAPLPVSPYLDVIGQTDSSGNPIFTKGEINNLDNSGLNYPRAICVDEINKRLFVADTDNNRVLIYNLNLDLTLSDCFADFVLGQPDFYSSTPATTQNGMYYPSGLAYDNIGSRLFVTDGGNHRILVFNLVDGIINGENAVNVLGQIDFTSTVSTTTQSNLQYPGHLAYDSANNRLFVADTGHRRVLVFDVVSITNGENAINVLGQPDFVTSSAAMTQNGFTMPTGICYDNGDKRLFVSDTTVRRVMVFDVTTITDGENAVNRLGVEGVAGNELDHFNDPEGLTYDPTNKRLFVADRENNRIMVFDAVIITDGENAVNLLGQPDIFNTSPSTTQSGLSYPVGVNSTNDGKYLFVADWQNSRVMVFDSTTITNEEPAVNALGHIDSTGNVVYTSSGINNPRSSSLYLPDEGGIALDAVDHRLFVADTENCRVLVYNLNENRTLVDRYADFVLGQLDFYSTAPGLSQSSITWPCGLTYDSARKLLFVTDSGNNRVLVFDVTTIVNGQNAVNVLGQLNFNTSDAIASQNGLWTPRGLAYDPTNNRLFVADCGYNRVMVFDVSEITNGENAIAVLGQPDFTSNDSAVTQSGMNYPAGLAYDAVYNRLFVADGTNHRILIFDLSGGITNGEDAIAVLGQPDFTSRVAATTQNGLRWAIGQPAYDSVNNYLFVPDSGNNRILVFDVNTATNGENAIKVIGQPDFTSNAPATSKTGLRYPQDIAYDTNKKLLFVADTENNRVMVLTIDF